MHKIDSNPKPSNWTLYYRDGLPVIGQAAVSPPAHTIRAKF